MKFSSLAVAAASGSILLLARAASALDCPAAGTSVPVALDGSNGVSLGIVTDPDTVCTLILVTTDPVSGDETMTPYGRSYSGYDWEAVSPTNQAFMCASPACSATLPAPTPDEEYRLVSRSHTATEEEAAARLLIQTTFGPSNATVHEYVANYASSPASFVEAQMSLTPTLHRSYFRINNQARTHAAYDAGRPRMPCEEGSRWRSFALTWEDKDLPISVDNTTSAPYTLRVQGQPRTQYATLPSPFFPGYAGTLCGRPGPSIGGRTSAKLPGQSCLTFDTPKVEFFDEDPRAAFAGDADGPIFIDLPGPTEMRGTEKMVHPAAIPEDAYGSCAAAPLAGGKTDVFGKDPLTGEWWIHDPMLMLRTNTPSSPLSDGGSASAPVPPSLCASAPVSYQNEQYCVYNPTSCASRGIVCPGDVNEVANDPLSVKEFDFIRDSPTDTNNNAHIDFEYYKIESWMNIALHSDDQLRQRVAWALAQIFAMTAGTLIDGRTERYLNFYDIFVKHAFGNFRDILKDISFNPLMGSSLTFLDNKSADRVRKDTGDHTLPDENFAREIMELFTIGLWKLNADGTYQLDGDGQPVATYGDNDIREMARVWTGFTREGVRGNIEGEFRNNGMTVNWQDPMKLVSSNRDSFPKRALDGGYLADNLPLCADMPDKPWLRKAATWRLLGTSYNPTMFDQDAGWKKDGDLFIELSPTEPLATVLCNGDPSSPLRGRRASTCTYPFEVKLASSLPPDTSATSLMDAVRVVKVNDVYYEYVQAPCVDLSFYDGGRTVKWERNLIKCSPPDAMHGTACCTNNGSYERSRPFPCEYPGERMKYGTHEQRCAAASLGSCSDWSDINGNYCGANNCCAVYFYHWTSSSCDVQVKVTEEGRVGILHVPEAGVTGTVDQSYDADARNYFHVDFWAGDDYPRPSNSCGNGVCTLGSDDTCVCPTSTVNEAVFGSAYFASAQPADLSVIPESLKIGSVDPDAHDAGVYTLITTWTDAGMTVQAWEHQDGAPEDIVVGVTENGTTRFFKNLKSTVKIAGTYEFRNAPRFRSDLSSALYETDLVIDSLFHHQNTAPFISSLLIQRFGGSNPSPGYVGRVSSAFTTGLYTNGGISFGTGEYGDLAATVAAVLLDQETRTVAVEADPTNGALREPLLRVVHMLRALEYSGDEVFRNMDVQIGQMPYDFPSVFSFFLPHYAPAGPVLSAGLVAPEAFQYDTPQIVGLMKGLFSLTKYGMTNCYGGFYHWGGDCPTIAEGTYASTGGQLTYVPTSSTDQEMIEEVDLLLTGGRLSDATKSIIVGALADNQGATSDQKLRLTEQLILASPEYHASGQVELDESKSRDDSSANAKDPESYKAIVYVFMEGGADTYNLLVPHSNCGTKDMYAEYAAVRGTVAIAKESLLPIDTTSTQPCSTFGVHPSFTALHQMYLDGDATFFANTGFLNKPSDRTNYRANHKGFPIFSHTLQGAAMKVNPQGDLYGTGVLGRMMDVLSPQGYLTASTTTGRGGASSSSLATGNDPTKSPRVSHLSGSFIPTPFDPVPSVPQMPSLIKGLNNATALSSSMFGETWSSALLEALDVNDFMFEMLHTVSLDTTFPSSSIGQNLELVARLIKARDQRKVERDAFAVVYGSFDTHGSTIASHETLFGSFNSALASFAAEMKSQQIWDHVVLVAGSEFGRSLSPNGGDGTDHGWGGNYFAVGGAILGGKIHGSYPGDLTSSNPQIIGRGIVPTMGFEGIFNGIASWFGVEEQDLESVIPNRAITPLLLSEDDMFHLVTNSPTASPSQVPSSVPSPGTPEGNFESVSTSVSFDKIRTGNTGKIQGIAQSDSRVTISSTFDGPDHLMSFSITGQDFDGGGLPNDSLSWKMRVRGMRGLSTYMCNGFCSSASFGTSGHQVYTASLLGWGVIDNLVDAKESLIFSVEDIVLETDHRGTYSASFDGFDRIWLTAGQYIFGYGTNVEGRSTSSHSVQILAEPMEEFQLTVHRSRERNREIGGKFTVSGLRDLCVEDGTACISSSDCCNQVCHGNGYCGDDIFMSQIQWTETFNLALAQPATQSSTGSGGVASRAVDGNTNGVWSASTTTHTSSGAPMPAWWRVDLTRPGMVGSAVIDAIVLYNRIDCCSFRMDYLKVRVLDAFGFEVASRQIEIAGSVNTFTFDPPVEGVTVEVVKDDTRATDSVISLAEVVVDGKHQFVL